MNLKYWNLFIGLFVFISAISCQNDPKANSDTLPGIHKFVVSEVVQASDYSYLKGKDNDKETWIATNAAEYAVGKTYYYKTGMEMKNFESKQLKKKFETLILVDKISEDQNAFKEPTNLNQNIKNFDHKNVATQETASTEPIKISPEKDCITIKELFSNKDKYKGKKVRVKGKVTKYNEAIMNKNWIHIKDGTDFNGKNDLTATSAATCKVGDIVIFEGTITTDKDFGYGYLFDVIIEGAAITASK